MTIQEKFAGLGIDNAPGQEALQKKEALDLRGEKLLGARVDFSHGDVDAHMPTPGSFDVFKEGFEEGGSQAYTPVPGAERRSWTMWPPVFLALQGPASIQRKT